MTCITSDTSNANLLQVRSRTEIEDELRVLQRANFINKTIWSSANFLADYGCHKFLKACGLDYFNKDTMNKIDLQLIGHYRYLSNLEPNKLKQLATSFRKFFQKSQQRCLLSNIYYFTERIAFFNKLRSQWKENEAVDAVITCNSLVGRERLDAEGQDIKAQKYEMLLSKLVPFSQITPQHFPAILKRWRINSKNEDEVIVSNNSNTQSITPAEWNTWLKTIATQECFMINRTDAHNFYQDLSYLYVDLKLATTRNGFPLTQSNIIQLFEQYCAFLAYDAEKNPELGSPLSLFVDSEKTDMNRRARIVASIIDSDWFLTLDNTTNINENNLLRQQLTCVGKQPELNFTIGELIQLCCPQAVENGKLAENFSIKRLYDTGVIVDSIDGNSKANGYYHSPRYLLKPSEPQKLFNENIESIEIRLHGSDRFSEYTNSRFLPCIKITLFTEGQNGQTYNYCFNPKDLKASKWIQTSTVENDPILKGYSHILFTPNVDVSGRIL